jgi:hypothetical protein
VSASQGPRWGGVVPGRASSLSQTTAPAAANGNQPRTTLTWNLDDYPAAGEVHGRAMQQPTLANPIRTLNVRTVAWTEQDLPFVSSNNLCTFSVFETATGLVSSYCFDTRNPASPVVKFDEFRIG